MNKLKELKEKRAKAFGHIDELRKKTDGRKMTGEEQNKWTAMLGEYDRLDAEVKAEERFQDIEKRQAAQSFDRNSGGGHGEPTKDEKEYRSAFVEYLVKGDAGITPESRRLFENRLDKEQRAGITGVAGGVIVPKTLADQVEIALKSFGGMIEAGTMFQTSHGGDLSMPTVNDTNSKATIVAEYQKSEKKAPSFGSVNMKAHTYRTPIVPVSLELLQDSAFDLESLLGGLLADSFGRGTNEHFTTGDGVGKPKGIIESAVASDVTPAANAMKCDDLIDLMASVDSNYAKDGKFMFHRKTLFALMKLKDSTGRFIWQEGLKDGTPPTILGQDYILNDDMPQIGAGNASVVFGALSKYRIRLVKEFRVIRLNELLAEYLSIGIFGFARMDGLLLDAGTNPVKKLVHAAA